jgi:hypothetical protein
LVHVFAPFNQPASNITDITVTSCSAVCYRPVKILITVVFSWSRIYTIV